MAKPISLNQLEQAPQAGADTPDVHVVMTAPPAPDTKGVQLARKHDFAAKFRQESVIERLKEYVLCRADVRRAAQQGRDLPLDRALPDYAPVSINLDLTTACNYACDHCVDMDILNKPIKFDHDRLLDSLRIMTQRGLKSVIVIGGGEPTVHPKFCETIRYMKSLGLQIAIVSNGSGYEKIAQIADCLDTGDWVRLSLDSATDETFTAMHKPKRPITLDEICGPVPAIKKSNPRFQFGFSFIITWKDASINHTKIVENLHEILPAAERARKFAFDYISFKPFLTRAEQNNAEIVDLNDTDAQFDAVMVRIREQIVQAKRLETDQFKVLEATNLRVMESKGQQEYMHQPRHCHMQHFRQVLSPLGIYNCPVYRNQPHGRVSDKDGYADMASYQQTKENTASLIADFDASHQCREVTCLYNHVNWWIEDLIKNPDKLNDLRAEPLTDPDFFF